MDPSTDLKIIFEEILEDTTRVFKTPSTPKTLIIRPKEGDPLISPERQKQFRMGVGMLLYLVKHSRPDISNSVRELLKVADGATEVHFKALLCKIKYVIDAEELGLLIQPKFNNNGFYLEVISDSEYTGDPDTRCIIVYGDVLYFCGAPIAWKSKAGKSVTLSSTEAEYYATSEIAKEVIFAKNLLEEMGIQLKFPINIKCDNVGAIYLANNHCTSQMTKHIDTRQHFVREWVEDEILKILFTTTLNNTADIFTKNTTEEVFHTHVPKLVGPIPNKAEMCNFTSARYEDLVLENEHQDWIVVSKRKKKKKKPNIQSIPPCFKGTKNKPLTRKERRRKQQAKEVYEPIHISGVPGRTELDLSAENLEAMKTIPKVEHYTP
jgi:hypothetical protein